MCHHPGQLSPLLGQIQEDTRQDENSTGCFNHPLSQPLPPGVSKAHSLSEMPTLAVKKEDDTFENAVSGRLVLKTASPLYKQ